ncbi:MAG: hypothetical protein ABI946_00595 [Chthoniobacterales bacterium]
MIARNVALLASCTVLLFGAIPSALAEGKQTKADEERFGIYPIAYQELIPRWMEEKLVDPKSALYEWVGEPKRVTLKGKEGKTLACWRVDFKVNSRNRFGAYTGKQARHVYIRNAEVFTLPQ